MYVTPTELRDYAASVGVDLSSKTDDELTVLLTQASNFIDAHEPRLIGRRTDRDQPYAFPRVNLVINGFCFGDDEIPEVVKQTQMAFALEVNSGVDLFGAMGALPVKQKTVVGVVSVEYATPTTVKTPERQSRAMSLLRQLMRSPTISVPLVRA